MLQCRVSAEVARLELLLLGMPDTWLGMFGVASCSSCSPVPLCRSWGVVEAPDSITREKAMVLRNAGSRYNVEVTEFTKGNSLSIFSLIFTEFESEGFLFQTMWQWKGGA